MIRRRRFHRSIFITAGTYNVAWGLYAAYDPQWLFRFAGLPPLNHPQIFQCLGMVVGLYGILYWEVARVPERGWLIAAVGLLGKISGTDRAARLDLESHLARLDNRLVPYQRSDLVDSVFALPLRRMAFVHQPASLISILLT